MCVCVSVCVREERKKERKRTKKRVQMIYIYRKININASKRCNGGVWGGEERERKREIKTTI